NGCFDGRARAATLEHHVREELAQQEVSLALLVAKLRHPRFSIRDSIQERAAAALAPPTSRDPLPWAQAGRVNVDHPLSPAWYGLLRGAPLPGNGDEYTIHLQEPGFAQGFRAVWDVGNWDSGGIVLPSGESGEPGSGHYDDSMRAWVRGEMIPLPFSPAALARATVSKLTLKR
ncbi:MAG TPA: penicillin acylase family protein, partial [Candidatus Baltobacteraceae bacterium]|nr:penicillin acylase family protein [Candidatus Baltobacteraceae bacterium]